jgi:hypothetical protein
MEQQITPRNSRRSSNLVSQCLNGRSVARAQVHQLHTGIRHVTSLRYKQYRTMIDHVQPKILPKSQRNTPLRPAMIQQFPCRFQTLNPLDKNSLLHWKCSVSSSWPSILWSKCACHRLFGEEEDASIGGVPTWRQKRSRGPSCSRARPLSTANSCDIMCVTFWSISQILRPLIVSFV